MRALQTLPARDCYGVKIEEHITEHLDEVVDLAQIYITLRRLQQRQFVTSKQAPSPASPGHVVTVYKLTRAGAQAISASTAFYRKVDQVYR
jgi:DNA-binding PadR family transcriptional regulator